MGGYFLGSLAVLILCAFLSLFSALTYYLIKRLSVKDNILFNSFLIIFFFSIFDWIKGNILWGFPWTPLAVIWSSNSSTLAPFSYIGVWGYSLVTYSLVVGVYLFYKNIKLSVYFVLPFVFILLLSNFTPRKFISVAENFHVRLIQPNISQIDKLDETKTLTNLNLLINLTNHEYKKNIDLVVWPETAVLFDIMDEENKKLLLKKNLENIDHLIIGGIRKEMVNKKKKYL